MKKITLFLFAAVLSTNSAVAQTGNQGLNFDGIDDRVTVPNNAAYNVGTGNFTIEAWVKLSTTSNALYPMIVSTREAGNVNSGMLFFLYSGRIMVQIAGSNIGQGNVNIKDNICHHVAVTRTGTVINYYVDGNLDATFSSAGSISSAHSLWIGNDEPNAANSQFKGLIHELRYWNIGRTQSQIQSTKNAFLAGNESGLIGYWRMNDGSGQIVNDLTSINNDGFLGSVNTTDSADPVYQPGCLCPSTITAGGPVAFCTGGNVVLTAASGAGLTYQWQLNASNISGATSISYTATLAGNYTCIVTGLCGAVTSNTITVTVYTGVPSAVITAGGSTTFCSGGSVTLNANTGAGITYQWQLNSSNITGATNSGYTASVAGTYRCVETNPCGSSTSNTIAVTVNSNPTATITPSGTVTFCTGGSALLTASSGAGYTWQWKKNGTDISGATSQTYSVNSSGNYTVAVTAGGCTATSAIVTAVADQPLTPTITNSGISGFCGSTTVNLGTSSGTGFIFQWFEDTHPIPNTNNSTLVAGHNGNYSVNVTNTCGTYSSSLYTVTNFDIPPYFAHYNIISPTGSLTICATGGSVNLHNDGNTNYYSPTFQWYKDGVVIAGAVSSAYTATATGDYVCSVRDYLFCIGGYGPIVFSNWLTVSSTPGTAPTVSISAGGPTSFCSPGNVTLNSTVNTSVSYQWRNNGVNISGATNASYTATLAGSYTLAVTNSCGSATSSSITVTVISLPTPTITAGGPTTFCTGGSVVLNANTGSGLSYQWKLNTVNISGATNISYTATSAGSYTVFETNSCSSATSSGITVTVNSLPTAAITAGGPTTFCPGGSVVLNANTGTGLSYQWKLNTINISSATNASYTAASAGTYTVVVTASGGCSAISNSIVVTITVAQQYIWTQKANFGGGLRYAAFSFSIGTKGYAGLGIQWNGAAVFGLVDVWEYDPAINVWTQKANFPGVSRNAPTGFSIGSKGYVTTGWTASSQLNDTWEYNPATNTWTQKANFGGTARYTATSFTIGNFAYVGTGYSPLKNDFWKYDPSTNSWTQIANVGGIPRQAASGFATGGYGYVFGGGVQFGAHLNHLWQYNPATNIWVQKTSCPGTGRAGAAAFTLNNKGYVGLGADDANSFQDFYEYDPTLDMWSQISDFGGGTRYSAIAFSAGNKGYVGTGSSAIYPNINLKQDLWELNVNCVIQSSVTPSGPLTFCQGNNVILSVPNVSCTSYQWKLNNLDISGATSSAYTVSLSGSYSVQVTNSCSSATSSPVIVTVNPLPTVSFSGLAASYNVTSPPATLTGSPAGGTFSGPGISGNTFNPSVAGAGGPYTIIYSYTDGNGCSNSSSQTTTVSNCIIPAMPSSITGTTTPCANSTGIPYSCPSVSGATSYTWTVPSTATIASGQGTTSITVNFGSAFTSGTIGVSASSCAGSSAQKTKNVFGKPATPGGITGQKTGVCAGTSNIPYSIIGIGGATTYTWTAPANASIASGQGTISIVVNYNSSFSSGTLSVTAGNSCGTSAAKTAAISSKPPTPGAITGPTTFCSNQQGVAYSVTAVNGATIYNWLVPTGAAVATGQGTNSITVNFGTKNGKVKVSAGNACGFSAYKQLNVTKNCRESFGEPETENAIKVYPNPSSGDFIFEISNAPVQKISINIYDMIGKLVLTETFNNPQFTIRDPQLVPGIYSAEIIFGENKKVIKLVKTD